MTIAKTLLALAVAASTPSAFAALSFDDDVTNDAIFGDGNANGGWTIFRDATTGVELGLRAKVRLPVPMNEFNSDGAGTYTHFANNFGTPTSKRASWNYEFSINSNYNGSGTSFDSSSLTYALTLDFDPGPGTTLSFTTNPLDGVDFLFLDNAYGTNATGNGDGVSAPAPLPGTNVAQNSQNYGFLPGVADATNNFQLGTYTISLSAFDGSTIIGGTSINVNAVVPEPSVMLFGTMMASMLGVCLNRRGDRDEV